MTGKASDFKVFQDEFQAGFHEALQQEVSVLNATGAIRVITANTRGEFRKSAFFNNIDGLIQDRDNLSLDPVAPKKLTQSEVKDILLDIRVGPVANTLDSFRKINADPRLMSFLLGQMQAEHFAEKYLNTGLAALTAAIKSKAELVFDNTDPANAAKTGGATVSVRALNRAKALLGDKQNRLRMIVAPSVVYNEMVDNQISEKYGSVSGDAIYGGQPGSLGLPVFVTDSPALTFVDGGDTKHNVLLLTEDALVIDQNDYIDVHTEIKTGLANIVAQYQGETSMLFQVKGFSFNGTARDTASLSTSANWDYIYASIKLAAGVALVVAD